MPFRLALVALLAVAGCGGSGVDQLAGPTQTPTQRGTATRTTSPTAAATVAATAQVGTASPRPAQSPEPGAAPSTLRPTTTTAVVRDGDSGSTVHLLVGQRIRVRLEQGTWDPPASTAADVVVRRRSTGGYPTSQPVDAVFEALKTGTADLQAQSDAACFHVQPQCLMPTRLWQVHVVVTV